MTQYWWRKAGLVGGGLIVATCVSAWGGVEQTTWTFPFVALLYFGSLPLALPEAKKRPQVVLPALVGGVAVLAGFTILGAAAAGAGVLSLTQANASIGAVAVLAVEVAILLSKRN